MHPLLDPPAPPGDVAAARCRAHLRRRSGAWRAGLALHEAGLGDDLAACGAFWELSRELGAAAAPDPGLARLAAVVDGAAGGTPDGALGVALAAALRRRRLPPFLLHQRVRALRSEAERATVGDRDELEARARRLAAPAGRLGLRLLGVEGEREEVLADALAVGVQLGAWVEGFAAAWTRGRLLVPMDELAREGLAPRELAEGEPDARHRRVVARQIAGARAWLAKGWPLTERLGPWRGRELALFLRWRAAGLGAVEARRWDLRRGRPRGGLLRLVACASASAVSRRSPLPPPG